MYSQGGGNVKTAQLLKLAHFKYLRRLSFARLIFVDDEILIASSRLVSAVVKYTYYVQMTVAEKEQIFAKLRKIYKISQYEPPLFSIQVVKKQNYSFKN